MFPTFWKISPARNRCGWVVSTRLPIGTYSAFVPDYGTGICPHHGPITLCHGTDLLCDPGVPHCPGCGARATLEASSNRHQESA